VVLGDEVDRYPASAGDEGDPLALAYKRSATFWNRKRIIGSSPTIAGHSRIEEAYEQSDKRRFFIACPHCSEMQFLTWSQVHWTKGKPSTAQYACVQCGGMWDDADRNHAVSRGEWRATAEFNGVAGFHISQIYSPFIELREMVEEFEGAQGNPQRLKVFVNTGLGETWKEKGEAPDWLRLHERAEDYPIGTAPQGVLFLTAGVDVQHDRVEIYIWGWGRGLESWLIDYRVLIGDPNADAVWDQLDQVTSGTWPHAAGVDMPLVGCGADIGYATERVYKWLRRKDPSVFFAVKGVEKGAVGLGMPQAFDVAERLGKKKKRRAGRLWPVVGGIYKTELYGYLRLDRPTAESGEPYPAGYVHLAKFPEEIFKQLTAEQLVTKVVKHRRRTEWEKTRERNEALDCRVYARAAAAVFGIDRFRDQDWDVLESLIQTTLKKKTQAKAAEAPEVEAVQEPAEARPTRPQPRGGWLGNRKGWLR
jgi:phage terminase large subunit GpA-like protein